MFVVMNDCAVPDPNAYTIPSPAIMLPVALNPPMDDTLSVDIMLSPYASSCPVLTEFVLIEPVMKLGVLRFVAVTVVALMVDALTFVKLWTANGVYVVILPPEAPKASPK
jgi:hypothetical protein